MKLVNRTIAIMSLGILLFAAAGCETTTSGSAVGANRSQLLLVSSEQLDQMATEAYAKVKTDASQKGALNKDKAMLNRVRNISTRLQKQTGVFRRDAPGWQWEVNVISSNDLHARRKNHGVFRPHSAAQSDRC